MKHLMIALVVALAAGCSQPAPTPAKAPAPPPAPTTKVRWHSSFDRALLASAESGRPVMLFQLLGNLDDEFC